MEKKHTDFREFVHINIYIQKIVETGEKKITMKIEVMLTNNNKFLIYNNKTQNEQKIARERERGPIYECRQAMRYFFYLIQRIK